MAFIDDTKLIQVNNGADLAIDAVTLSGPVGDLVLQGPSGVVQIPSVLNAAGGILGSASAQTVTATGATASRSLSNRFAEEINVKDFGAKGDGVTDDAAAINAALTYLRAHPLAAGHTAYRIVFPYGRYVVKSSLNFTGLASFGTIEGCGSEIWGQMSGGVVVDALGSRFLNINNLSIYGDPTLKPAIGLQIGRTANGVSADDHVFSKVDIWGNFTFTSFYNFSAETSTYYTCSFRNNQTGSNAFCVVMDGLNHWSASSTFVTETAGANVAQSFNENLFVNCVFQGNGSNGVVWISNTSRHQYRSCYASNVTSSIFTLYGRSASIGVCNTMLDIDCHCETTGLAYAIQFTADPADTYLLCNGLSFADHSCSAGTSVFSIDSGSSLTAVEMRNLSLRVLSSTAHLFDTPAHYIARARYAFLSSGMWSGQPLVWTGPVEFQDQPALVNVPASTRISMTTGGSTSLAAYTGGWVNLVAGGTIASYTLVMPVAIGGQEVMISTNQQITSLTLTPNTGQTVSGSPGRLPANSALRYRFDTASSTWLCLGQTGAPGFADTYLPLTGGTVTGTTNFTGAGTAVGVTNQLAAGSLASNTTVSVGLPAGATSVVQMNAAAGNNREIQFLTNSLSRWWVLSSNEAESGANAGSNFYIQSYDDSGNFLANGLTINRATGIATMPTVRVGTTSGPTWTTGTGAPASTQPRGSIYSRADGTTGSTLYVSQGGGTWNAIAGV